MAFTGHVMSLSYEQLCECVFVMGRQKCWTCFAHDMLLGRLQSSHLCAGEGKVRYKLLLHLCSKTKKFVLRVCFNLFFSQKQFQLSLLILLCFHSLIIFANQL